jgi:hypothetical protein
MTFSCTKRFLLIGVLHVFLTLQSNAQSNFPKDPQDAKILYSDLIHFTEAYKELSTNTDTLQVLQELYFDRGSEGLKEFISRHQLTPELIKDALSADPERYALLPGFLANIAEVEEQYLALMKDFDKAIPNAMYPPTYLLVGANRGIGQASQVGQLITVVRPVDSPEKLKNIMAHELSHFQQAMAMGGQQYAALYSSPNNLLGLCLREGGAEFLASLVVNDITQKKALDYLMKDEKRLKEQFLRDLETQNADFWLWASIEQKEYPKLLGYAMGYMICKHYYESASDKTHALQEILLMKDAEAFIKASGYFDL